MVVVVAYGNEDHLRTCLATLGQGHHVVVVDNGRSDEAQRICLTFGADYSRPAGNLGFAAAVNVAIKERRIRATDVLLLNPDARLAPADLDILRDRLRIAPDLAAVGPRLARPDGQVEKALWPIPSPWVALATIVGASDRITRRRFVSGAVLLLRGTALDSIGRFDERFFLYSEEADWQLRALRLGWKVGLVNEAAAMHLGGATSSNATQRELYFHASAELFVRKWYRPFGWEVYRIATIATALRRLVTSGSRQCRDTQRRVIRQYWRGPVLCAKAPNPKQ